MSEIVLESVVKQYGETPRHAATPPPAVDHISFTLQAGTLNVLLGPSGCGKSTTLRMIAGLDTPTSGRVYIGGRDVTDLAPAQRKISMVFQSYALFPHLTVKENILFGLRVRKEPRTRYAQRLSQVAELLGLTALLERKPSQLSGGQQQRVALGRAVISQAPVCLMDEPLSNLDAQLRHDMRREIRALQQQLGITMVYVTHDQTEAMSMADRVVLLNAGRIEQNDTPDLLYSQPRSTFAARFIGTPPMNLLTLDNATCQALQGWLPADAPITPAGRLGIRPEHIELVAPPAAAGACLDATVETVEYFGADSIVVCRIGGNRGVAVRAAGHVRAQADEHICLRWRHEYLHFFDDAGQVLPRDAGAASPNELS
ncbi:ATP-binding cassette domain-containing protein [Pusillimonas sp. TS35]|nr:ATP-binding cassette domain-containing protein [Pusillimonas sp. TS35]